VVPHSQLSWFVTPITWVYGKYTELLTGGYKPTFTSLGGHHFDGDFLIGIGIKMGISMAMSIGICIGIE
jgi:hypothetical protein